MLSRLPLTALAIPLALGIGMDGFSSAEELLDDPDVVPCDEGLNLSGGQRGTTRNHFFRASPCSPLICGQFAEHREPSILQRIHLSAILHFPTDSRYTRL